jgi:hypothetical protein
MSNPSFRISIDTQSKVILLGNDDIGTCSIKLRDEEQLEWAENFRDLLEENGFDVDFDEVE